MRRGYARIWRKFQDHPFWKEPREFSKAEAWMDIVMEAQHSEEPKKNTIKMTLIMTYRGDSIKSILTWADRWRWTKSKARRFLNLLQKMGMIRLENVTVTTRLSVVNYNLYNKKRTGDEPEMNRKRTGDEPEMNTDNNVKKVNNVKKDKKKRESFAPPTREEAKEFAESKGYLGSLDKFFDHYEKVGWKVKGRMMIDWKAALRGAIKGGWASYDNSKSKVISFDQQCKDVADALF